MAKVNISGLDELDNKILSIIKDNARLSYTEIAEQCEVTRVSVKNRMETLENKGIIRGYKTIIEPGESDTGVKFFLNIEIKDLDCFDETSKKLSEERLIRELYICSGPNRLYAIGVAPDTRNLRGFVGRLYKEYPGIRNIGINAAMSTIKNVDGGIDYAGDQAEQ